MGQPIELTGNEWSPEDEMEIIIKKLKYIIIGEGMLDDKDLNELLDDNEYWESIRGVWDA